MQVQPLISLVYLILKFFASFIHNPIGAVECNMLTSCVIDICANLRWNGDIFNVKEIIKTDIRGREKGGSSVQAYMVFENIMPRFCGCCGGALDSIISVFASLYAASRLLRESVGEEC